MMTTPCVRLSEVRFSRRRVLGGVVAGVAPLVLPWRLFGDHAPSKRVHLLMLGTGRQACLTNLPTLLGMPEVRVVAVCDVDRNRAGVAKQKVDAHYGDGGCRLFTDFREALAMADLDAVMNSTTDHWHVITSLAAVAKGLHVSCEKPLTRWLREGRVLADAVKAKGVVFRTDSECRSHSYMTRVADLAINGYLGNIRHIEVGVPREAGAGTGDPTPAPVPAHLNYDLWLGPAPHADYCEDRVHSADLAKRPGWMRILDYAEGIITNWGTHLLDVAQLLNGTERGGPVHVEARGERPEGGLWNTLTGFDARFRYANGVTLAYRMDVPYIRVEGDEGWVKAHWNSAGGLTASDPAILRTRFRASDRRVPTRSDKMDFISAIRDGTPTMIDAEIGHRTCSMGQIAHIAIQRGRPLDWDPVREEFPGDPESNKLLVGAYRGDWWPQVQGGK